MTIIVTGGGLFVVLPKIQNGPSPSPLSPSLHAAVKSVTNSIITGCHAQYESLNLSRPKGR